MGAMNYRNVFVAFVAFVLVLLSSLFSLQSSVFTSTWAVSVVLYCIVLYCIISPVNPVNPVECRVRHLIRCICGLADPDFPLTFSTLAPWVPGTLGTLGGQEACAAVGLFRSVVFAESLVFALASRHGVGDEACLLLG